MTHGYENDAAYLEGAWDVVPAPGDYTHLSDIDGLSTADIRILARLGLYPGPHADLVPSVGTPYVSDMGKYRSLHFDWDSLQSEMDREDPLALTVDYTRMMMGFLLFNPLPARIEMIGLGGGSLAKLCHFLLPQTDITVVEISGEVIALRDQFCVPRDDDRFRVVHADGADYVRQSSARPDVLLVDGFDIDGQPAQLCSAAFYRHCRNRLTPRGVLVANLWGGDRNAHHHVADMRACFDGRIVVVPTEEGTNQAVIARKSTDLGLGPRRSSEMAQYFPQRQAAFLPSIGARVRHALERLA